MSMWTAIGAAHLQPHHLKRLNAPSSWMLDKLSGTYAPRPSNGPHKVREALPLIILLRNRLKYALNGREVVAITAQRLIKIDGKVRTDPTYPTGFMDVVSIEKSGEHFRILYDAKGRFIVHRISAEEATYKLLKVKKVQLGARGVPHIVTHDGRTIRYPDPAIKVNDTVRFDIENQKLLNFVKFDTGAVVMVTGGRNQGRVGTITGRERHVGGFDIVHIRDVIGRDFSTRLSNVFVIGEGGEGNKPMISLPRGGGVKLTITEERDQRRRQKEAQNQ
ncbi:40S ribosomal protein S4 [Testicularia cyperi]|uniref:40S ribosomal protein S4 n=1 Tax=Testicularia cyperi TaxID=1882483 RepID=A0A317XWG4_9BASI|nr:40S ribosomal protein S4 [Testicularia cyperi]